jgi:hypothetical protein
MGTRGVTPPRTLKTGTSGVTAPEVHFAPGYCVHCATSAVLPPRLNWTALTLTLSGSS